MLGQEIKRPKYTEIKDYLKIALKDINIKDIINRPIIRLDGREITVRSIDEKGREIVLPAISIPRKSSENLDNYFNAWVEVYLKCLDYYQKKLQKDDVVVNINDNSFIISGRKFNFPNPSEYILKLEELVDYYAEKHKKGETIIKVKESSLTIEPPKNLSKQQEAIAKGKLSMNNLSDRYIIAGGKTRGSEKVQLSSPNNMLKDDINKVNDSKIKPSKHEKSLSTIGNKRKKVNYDKLKKLESSRFVCPKLTDDIILEISECEIFSNQPLVFVPGNFTGKNSSKGEITFQDNIDLLKNNANNTLIAAFTNGTAMASDKVSSESKKILKLCKDINSKIICYEINNEAFRKINDSQKILEAYKSASLMAETLVNNGYLVILSADLDVRQKINNAMNNLQSDYVLNYPILSRISPKELDDITDDMDLLIMDPGSDYDQIILTDNTALMIKNHINSLYNKKMSSS